MFRGYDMENGIGPKIYRSPAEVREDVKAVKLRIKEVSDAVNLRDLLLNILTGERSRDPENLITTLSEAVEEAKEALEELRGLEEELYELEEELREVKWITGF